MDPTQLRRLAGRWRIPLGTVEKEQAMTVVLGVLSSLPSAKHLAFKGGSALRIIYFEDHRLSEDLDFTVREDVAGDILSGEGRFLDAGRRAGVRVTRVHSVRSRRSSKSMAIRYDDMNGHGNRIRLEFSLRERVILPAEARPIRDPYGVLEGGPGVPTMDLREILAEKIRALYMRSAPRDLFDLWILARRGVPLEIPLVDEKLVWWRPDVKYSPPAVRERIAHLEPTWDRDLRPLLANVPPFSEVAEHIIRAFGTE